VIEVGTDVTKHAVGDSVGVGTIVNSCRECDNCRAGEEQYCLQGNTQAYCSVDRDGTITQGGYSTHVVVDEDFVLRIPETLDFSKSPRSCAPASRCTRRCDTGGQGPALQWPWSAWEGSATSQSSWRTPWVRR
jgi:D-arabinose 1-dehydrogenase-like Zn-dependent alcohol dehydrogenase